MLGGPLQALKTVCFLAEPVGLGDLNSAAGSARADGQGLGIHRRENFGQLFEEICATLLVGPHRDRIRAEANRLLDDKTAYDAMAQASNPYGDGALSARIADAVENWLKPAGHLDEAPC